MSNIRQSMKLNSSMSIGSENVDPNLSFGGADDDESPPSPWTVKRKSILKNSDNAKKVDSNVNI